VREIFELIWNAPAWVIVAVVAVPVCLWVAGMIRLIRQINKQRVGAGKEFELRRKEIRERLDRGARRMW